MHTIEELHAKHRIVLTMQSYKDHNPEQFIAETQAAAIKVKGGNHYFDLLADFSLIMVMPQDIAKQSEGLAEWLVANGLRRSANIVPTTTQKMQIQRVTNRDAKFGFFHDLSAAETWLDEGRN
ncbi:MAG: hypothetical protein ABJP34_02415 [Erythrobacter sp.]